MLHHSRAAAGFIYAEAGLHDAATNSFERAIRAATELGLEQLTTTVLGAVAATGPPVGADEETRALLWAIAHNGEHPPARPLGPWRERLDALAGVDTDLGLDHGLRLAAEALRPTATAGLTRREREILALVSRGMTDREVATELSVGVRTVNSHVSSILRKLGVPNRREAVALTSRRPPLY